MGKVLELLSPEWVDLKVEDLRAALAGRYVEPPAESLRKALKTSASGADADPADGPARLDVEYTLTLAAPEHARGAAPDRVRQTCRDLVDRWLPLVEKVDFTPRAAKGGARDQTVPQPMAAQMPKAYLCAAIAGDRDLARRFARAYPQAPLTLDPEKHQYLVRDRILRALLTEDDAAERDLAAKLRDGYPVDFPPQRIEFPLGVVNGDAEVLAAGIKATTTRFKGRWDLAPHRKRFEKLAAEHAKRAGRPSWRKPPTWEGTFQDVRKTLVNYHWVLSLWAVAFLTVARWRGAAGDVFDRPKLFSEWVPLELCH